MKRWITPLLGISLFGCGLGDCCREPPVPEPAACIGLEGRAQPQPSALAPGCSNDDYEPNGDLTLATTSPTGHECARTSKDATIAGDGDVDVFRTGECDVGTLHVARAITAWAEIDTADSALRLCVFPMCVDGATNVYPDCFESTPGDSPMDTDAGSPRVWFAKTDSRFRGCCRTGPGRVSAMLDCAHLSTSVDTFVWVDAGDESLNNQCSAYTVTYQME